MFVKILFVIQIRKRVCWCVLHLKEEKKTDDSDNLSMCNEKRYGRIDLHLHFTQLLFWLALYAYWHDLHF